jgi:uncharacterized SAM-binding protein YcdF (DUF218 family)
MVSLIKYSLLPGSAWFLLAGLSAGLGLLYGRDRARRWGRRWLLFLAAAYWTMSLPLVATALERVMTGEFGRAPSPGALRGAEAIVVLGAGSQSARASSTELHLPAAQTAFNVLEGARVYRQLARPLVIASGGAPLPRLQLQPEGRIVADLLVSVGVPPDRLIVESTAPTTRDQAINVARLLRARRVTRFVLVAGQIHMRRAVALFRAQGLDPVPAASPIRSEGGGGWERPWVPASDALRATEAVTYQYLAMIYAWGRGWLARAPS